MGGVPEPPEPLTFEREPPVVDRLGCPLPESSLESGPAFGSGSVSSGVVPIVEVCMLFSSPRPRLLLSLVILLPASDLRAQQGAAPQTASRASSFQGSSLVGGGTADSIGVVIVRIRSSRQKDYEQWLREVVVPAISQTQKRFASARSEWANHQLLVPAQATNDSTVTYMYMFNHSKITAEEPDRSKKPGWRGLLEDAGLAPAEIDRQLARLRGIEVTGQFLTFLETRLPISE